MGSMAREWAELARRLAAEREQAKLIVPRLLKDTPRSEWKLLAHNASISTAGALDILHGILDEQLTSDPEAAVAIAELGAQIAEELTGVYPAITLAQCRATALKDLGKTLSALARYDDAFAAFDRAESQLSDFLTLGYERAIIRLNVAITYMDVGRNVEARELLAECKAVFEAYTDSKLAVLSTFYEGLVLQRLQRPREAREVYLLLLTDDAADIPSETRAAIHQTIGMCSTELRDFGAAEKHLAKAIAFSAGQPLNVLRIEYARGTLLLRQGYTPEAIDHLRPIRHQFLRYGLHEEAGLCGLEIVEGYLTLGEADRAERLARTIMHEFLAASLNSRAITALGWLSETIASRKAMAAPRLATHVREYVISLRTSPERTFEAPRLVLLRDEG
jgi:tetratricopeptide (TPR) repeat protein